MTRKAPTDSTSVITMTGLAKVSLSLPSTFGEEVIGKIASSHEDDAVSISWTKTPAGWDVQWVFQEPVPLKSLKDDVTSVSKHKFTQDNFVIESIPDTNWLEESYRQFPPFAIKDFYVFGSHFKGKIPTGKISLQIDAATAFGSGEHGTTRGCLEALLTLKQSGLKPKSILDMGAGSGILGIAAYKLWKKPVLAIDIDKEATRVACHHRKINGIPSGIAGMTCATGDGYAARRVKAHAGGFQLIIANILAGPLVMMAPDLSANLAKKGMAILSGLLVEQEKEVLAAHKACGLKLVKRITHGEWRTLILSK